MTRANVTSSGDVFRPAKRAVQATQDWLAGYATHIHTIHTNA